MSGKAIVLDANILISAVLGKRVRELIFDSLTTVKFEVHPLGRRAYAIEGSK